MVRSPGRLPDGDARDLEADSDLGELSSDRLVLDDAAPALHPQLRVVEGGLIGGAADPEVAGLILRDVTPRVRGERASPVNAEKILRRHPAVLECHLAVGAVIPPRGLVVLLH